MQFRKISVEHRDPDQLSARLSVETSQRWDYRSVSDEFHHRLNAAFIGDFAIGQISTNTGYHLQREDSGSGQLELHFVESGRCNIATDVGCFNVEAGQVHLSRARRMHQIRAERNTAHLTIAVPATRYAQILGSDVSNPLNHLGNLAPTLKNDDPVAQAIYGIAQLLLAPNSESSPFQSAPLATLLLKQALLQTIVSNWPHNDRSKQQPSLASPRLRLAQKWIHSCLSEAITLKDIAEAAGIGPRSLQTLFKRELGVTPIQYVINIRLQHAHMDLVDHLNRETIPVLSARHGFPHVADFQRRYKELYGCSPSHTRRVARTTNVADSHKKPTLAIRDCIKDAEGSPSD